MDWSHFLTLFVSTEVPRLPDLDLLRWAHRLSWGVVLVGLGLMLMRGRCPRWMHWGWVGLMLVGVCLPGLWTPSFWLGLAFQSPSLMSTALLLGVSVHLLWPGACLAPTPAQVQTLWRWSLGAVALGWVLLLDTFALWPFSLYAFGFSPAAVLAVALCAIAPWVVGSAQSTGRAPLMVLGGVLLVYVGLRLPSGNIWDAVLDPWLWGALQVLWLARGLRRFNGWRRVDVRAQ